MEPRPDLDKQPTEVAAMFDKVARRYDLANDVLSLGQDRFWRRATTKAVVKLPGIDVLDVAAGTGTSTAAFLQAGARVTAVDFSAGMIEEGRRRHPDIEFIQGDAMNLPFDDASFDVVTISFGLRNVQDPGLALAEFYRVTRPGGRLVVCEFSRPVFPPLRWAHRLWLGQVIPRLARKIASDGPAYSYLSESILDWPTQVNFGQQIRLTGWRNVAFKNLTGGIVCLHRASKPV